MDTATAHVLVRFGLGHRPSDPVPADPVAWLLAQLAAPDPLAGAGPSTAEGLAALRADRKDKPPPAQSRSAALFRAGARAQLAHAVATDLPFRERLVWFWTNHFTVSVRRGQCAAVLPAFVAEAIRPHVTGRFADMLLAVMRHPAMLLYLDNASSIGPDSAAGQRSRRGLNENLARECLELHTVSPAAGYTQQDVTAFAAVLTGWSIDLRADPPGFRFRPGAHQPGTQTVLGQAFPPGEAGGLAALAFLAAHPATHRHLATQLTRHFVADEPPPAAIRAIEAVLRDTNGDLGAAAAALVRLETPPGAKLRTPQELAVASLRALDLPEDRHPDLLATLAALGQPFWRAPAPNGWPDTAGDWAGPEAMVRRIDFAWTVAGRSDAPDPLALAETVQGPLLAPDTRLAMQRAASRREALTLFLAAPAFQRR